MSAAVFLCLFLVAQSADAAPRLEKLGNGLRIVIVEDHSLPLAGVQLWYRAGAAQDALTQPGLCHLARMILEHRDDLALKLRAAGVRVESRTLRDACYFSSVLPSSFLEFALDREAERMRPLQVDPVFLRRMLAAAQGMNEGGADFQPAAPLTGSQCHLNQEAWRALLAAAFPKHPYQNPPGLVAESLARIAPEEVNEFLNHWFVPGNATLFIFGDVSPPRVLELVRQKFGPLPWREPPRKAELEPPAAETVQKEFSNAEQVGLAVAWVTPPWFSFENAAIDVLAWRLCNEIDGPLAARLKEQGCALGWQRAVWRDAGLLTLFITPDARGAGNPRVWPKESAAKLEKIVFEELAKAATSTPTEIQLNRARALATRAVLERRASFAARVQLLAAHEIIGGDLWLGEFEAGRLERIAPADLRRAAEILRGARTVMLQQTCRSAVVSEAGSSVSAPPVEALKSLDSAAALERLAQFAAVLPPLATPAAPPPVTVQEAGPGIRVLTCRLPSAPYACARTILPDLRKAPDVMLLLQDSGSQRHTAAEIRDYLSYWGLDLTRADGPSSGLEAHGPADFLPQMLELQAELIRTPLDPRAQEIRSGLFSGWPARFARSQAEAAGLADAYVYGVPPPPRRASPLSILDPAVLDSALARCRAPRRVQLLAVGDFDPAEALAAAANWSSPASQAATGPAGRRADPAVSVSEPPASPEEEPIRPFRLQTLFWMPGANPAVELRVILHLWTPSQADPGGLKTDAVAWLLGAPPEWGTALDAEQVWRWRCRVLSADTVVIAARAPREMVGEELQALLRRIAELRENRVPRGQLQTALRLARVTRLIALDNPDAVADVLQRGIVDPWKIDAPLEPDALLPIVSAQSSAGEIRIVAIGGGMTLPEGLRQLGEVEQFAPQPW